MNTKPDPLRKTTRIPFRFVKGKFVHFDNGTEITELLDGCIGDIVVEDFMIRDATRIQELNAEAEIDFLPKGTSLHARINLTGVPAELRDRLFGEEHFVSDGTVEILLDEDLQLHLRGTRSAQLSPCKCSTCARRCS